VGILEAKDLVHFYFNAQYLYYCKILLGLQSVVRWAIPVACTGTRNKRICMTEDVRLCVYTFIRVAAFPFLWVTITLFFKVTLLLF